MRYKIGLVLVAVFFIGVFFWTPPGPMIDVAVTNTTTPTSQTLDTPTPTTPEQATTPEPTTSTTTTTTTTTEEDDTGFTYNWDYLDEDEDITITKTQNFIVATVNVSSADYKTNWGKQQVENDTRDMYDVAGNYALSAINKTANNESIKRDLFLVAQHDGETIQTTHLKAVWVKRWRASYLDDNENNDIDLKKLLNKSTTWHGTQRGE